MIRVAWRNIVRSRLRTIITLISVIIGALFISFFRFFAFGTHQAEIWHVVGVDSGYIQVAANGWLENKTLDRALNVNPGLLKSLRVKGTNEISPRIFGYALASHKEHSRFITVLAADPEKERKITTLHKRIVKGKFFSTGVDRPTEKKNNCQ